MTTSGVNSSVYFPYRFTDHIWTEPTAYRDDLLELAHRCVKIRNMYWMKLPNSNTWVDFQNKTDAKSQAKNTWVNGTLACGTKITEDLIDTFFDGFETVSQKNGKKTISIKVPTGDCPHVQGRMVIPYGPSYLTYGTKRYLNCSDLTILAGDATHLAEGLVALRMLYRSLCNGPELHPNAAVETHMLLQQILDNTYTNMDFRFAVTWLAAIIQRPGINLQTNLWFVGEQQGVGKGTLLKIMKTIIGYDYVGNLDQSEIEGGWNDHLFGKVLIEVNEFDCSNKKGWTGNTWNKWIKDNTCEPEQKIRQRNQTAWTTLHIGNFIFTTNDESPIYLDKTDRRNMIIKVTDDVRWRGFAENIQRRFVIDKVTNIAAGFAWILEQVVVDMSLLKSAPLTQAKADIQILSMPLIEEWARHDVALARDFEVAARTLYNAFKDWAKNAHPSLREIPSENKWGREMRKLERVGVAKKTTNTGSVYQIPKIFVDTQITDGQENVRDIADIVGAVEADMIEDQPVVHPMPPDFDKMTPMQRFQVILGAKNEDEEYDRKAR